VRRQGGLGRTLADLLPDAEDPEPHPVEHHFPPIPESAVIEKAPTSGNEFEIKDEKIRDESEAHAEGTAEAWVSHTPENGVSDLGSELVAELATNQSGLSIVYRALDGLVEQYALHDAAVVIDESGLGRQVFRAARKPLDDPGGEALLDAEPGLYTDPPLEAAAVDASLVTSLCVVALRMEVLRYDSWHDPLTGLFDRRSFDRLLEMSVARSLRYHWPFTLVVIDLDGLKQINDGQGHAAGDVALQALSERFRRVLRFGDNAARIGGDEFAIILPNTDPDDVPMLLERIGSSQLGDRPCPAFSYGVAQCPAEADDTESLFKLADSRLYEAKKARR
jgi:diguanylate cyclase (GGDEF)-like protein